MADRGDIVKSLDLLAKQWIRSTGLEKGLNYTAVESVRSITIPYYSTILTETQDSTGEQKYVD